ncbi:hypothetical protein P692DRAFT_201246387 [Suillus brevipes Sb2]|nr:hypothetical protein P692DRAFT_201246387 [Suillus brevipes Sb2]
MPWSKPMLRRLQGMCTTPHTSLVFLHDIAGYDHWHLTRRERHGPKYSRPLNIAGIGTERVLEVLGIQRRSHQCFNYERSVCIWVGVVGVGTLCPLYNPSAVWTQHRGLRCAPRVQHAMCNASCIHIRPAYQNFLFTSDVSSSLSIFKINVVVQHNVTVHYPFRSLSILSCFDFNPLPA